MSFTDEDIQEVWEKGTIVASYDSALYRQDRCTAWMIRSKYGDRNSIYGWEIHHIKPDGGDNIANLIPMQWKNNVVSSDSGTLSCPVKSNGNTNVE